MDGLQFDQIGIEKLNLTVRSYNSLKRARINTLQQLFDAYQEGRLLDIKNLGMKSYQEIKDVLDDISDGGFEIEEGGTIEEIVDEYEVPKEIENISVCELKLSIRLLNGLIRGGFDTVGKMMRMSRDEIFSIHGIGSKSVDELISVRNSIKEDGAEYFESADRTDTESRPIDERHKRTVDIETVNKLRENYRFKTAWLSEWYGVTRSRVNQIVHKRFNRGNWLNRELTDMDRNLLLQIVKEKKEFAESEEGIKAYFLSNNEDDCAFLFVNDEEIKCFFLNMLPEDLQQIIRESRLDQLSLEELELSTAGRTSSVLKKEYFVPDSPYKFRQFANIRGMSIDEYCLFLTGKEYSTAQATVTDEKIIEFLNAHYTNGKLMIPSNNSTQWFRSFISRNGYSIDEIAELYGYADNQNQENDIQGLEIIEDDMRKYNIASEDWLDRLYAENPLIGNKIISEKTKERLFSITKGYIDQRLRNPLTKFNLKVQMQITLAIITYAKEWDTGDESGFWHYITSQFGYRDDTGQLRGILCDCVLGAMQKNRRWFLTSATGYQYKSTIVVHALTTERSWMHFYEFLFDFYKTNMEWTYIKDDPIIPRMVSALRSKLTADDKVEDENLEISSNVYSFQEGIRKLIIYRTGYAVQIISRMLERIHGIISHSEKPTKLYLDLLCNQWIESKLRSAKEVRNRGCNIVSRNVAIDYTRIRPQYSLSDETSPVIMLPDVRLKKTDFNKVELKVYTGNIVVESKTLSFYGNELGKTLKGFDIDLDKCMKRGDGSLNIRVVLSCDDEEIYDSRESLYRECLCFSKGKECDIKEAVKGSYSIFAPSTIRFEFSGAEVSEIDVGTWWSAYFVRLEQDFLIKSDGQILSYDVPNGESVGGVRVIVPSSNKAASFIKNGHHYDVLTKNEYAVIVAHEKLDFRKCIVAMNGEKIEISSIDPKAIGNGFAYNIPLIFASDNTCEFQIVDFDKNRIISRHLFKLITGFNVRFDKEFYFTEEDYDNSFVSVTSLQEVKNHCFGVNDENISISVDDGTLEVKIPRVVVRDSTGEVWDNRKAIWIKDIRQEDKMYLSYPEGCHAVIKIGNFEVTEESTGTVGFGNAVFAYSDPNINSWIEVILCLRGKYLIKDYKIGRISRTERFWASVSFDYHNGDLFWNRGLGFLGNRNGNFVLRLSVADGEKEYPLDLEAEIAIASPRLPLGEYDYQIVKGSENIFLGDETVLQEGQLVIGDKNELRFSTSMIEITNITYEEDGNLCSVDIRNTYINQIEYLGIQFVDSEDRECPVYRGKMFYMGKSLNHHEFSSERMMSDEGFQLYKINPVKIAFINEHTLSITDEDGDGIYYYRYFNKTALKNVYAITDREPTVHTRNTYYLADLYTYRKVRIQ